MDRISYNSEMYRGLSGAYKAILLGTDYNIQVTDTKKQTVTFISGLSGTVKTPLKGLSDYTNDKTVKGMLKAYHKHIKKF